MFDVPLAPRQELLKLFRKITSEVFKAGMLKTIEDLTRPSFSLNDLDKIVLATDADPAYIDAVIDSYRKHIEIAESTINDGQPLPKAPTNDKVLEIDDYLNRRREIYSKLVNDSKAAHLRIMEIAELLKERRNQSREVQKMTRDERIDRLQQGNMRGQELSHCRQTTEDCVACIYFGEDVLKVIIADREEPSISSKERMSLRNLIEHTGLFLLDADAPRVDREQLYGIYKLLAGESKSIRHADDIIKQVTEVSRRQGNAEIFDVLLAYYNHYSKSDIFDGLRYPQRAVEGASELTTLQERCRERSPDLWLEDAALSERIGAITKEINELHEARKNQDPNDYASLIVIEEKMDKCKREQDELLRKKLNHRDRCCFGPDVVPILLEQDIES